MHPNAVDPACIQQPHLPYALTATAAADLPLFCSQVDLCAGDTGAATQFSKTSSLCMIKYFGER